jgi:hypothetical protein
MRAVNAYLPADAPRCNDRLMNGMEAAIRLLVVRFLDGLVDPEVSPDVMLSVRLVALVSVDALAGFEMLAKLRLVLLGTLGFTFQIGPESQNLFLTFVDVAVSLFREIDVETFLCHGHFETLRSQDVLRNVQEAVEAKSVEVAQNAEVPGPISVAPHRFH